MKKRIISTLLAFVFIFAIAMPAMTPETLATVGDPTPPPPTVEVAQALTPAQVAAVNNASMAATAAGGFTLSPNPSPDEVIQNGQATLFYLMRAGRIGTTSQQVFNRVINQGTGQAGAAIPLNNVAGAVAGASLLAFQATAGGGWAGIGIRNLPTPGAVELTGVTFNSSARVMIIQSSGQIAWWYDWQYWDEAEAPLSPQTGQ